MRRFRCPYCGCNELQGRFCAYCDSLILEEEPQETRQPLEPQPAPMQEEAEVSIDREYDGCNTLVELQADAVCFRNHFLGKQDISHRIRYSDIRSLHYYRPKDKFISWGSIVIRCAENEDIPVPSRWKCDTERQNGDTIICFASGVEDWFFIHIFWYLRSMAPAGILWQIDSVDRMPKFADYLINRMDYDRYFRDCNPLRSPALNLLLKETTLSRKEARAVINRAYDRWQAELYDKDPRQVKHDLQRMVQHALNNRWTFITK